MGSDRPPPDLASGSVVAPADRLAGRMTDNSTYRESFTCPRCGMTSYNPTDVAERYCGHCHDWTGLEDWPFMAPSGDL